MKLVYILIDCDDRRNIHAFQQRRNAIQYAYERCKAFGAYLSVKKWDLIREKYQYQTLSEAVGNGDIIDYLNALNDEDVNDVFCEYYVLVKADIEDIERIN